MRLQVVNYEGSRFQTAAPPPGVSVQFAGEQWTTRRAMGPVEVLQQVAQGYEHCLLLAPLPTRALTQAGIWGLGDVFSQLYETRSFKQKRFWSFFFTGFGSGVVWACAHRDSKLQLACHAQSCLFGRPLLR